jgi:epoxyqueuosine reductase
MSEQPASAPAAGGGAHDWQALADSICAWGRELGFQSVGIADTDLSREEAHLVDWLAAGRHGDMDYMARHGARRARPAALVEGTISIISARMNYWPAGARDARQVLDDPTLGYVSRYAMGRDYHKLLRARLAALTARIEDAIGPFGHRVFSDSAPVMEVALGAKSGLGWRGKHTLLLTRDMGSLFFLGDIYTDLPLPPTPSATAHCGSCTACIDVCPTKAIVAPYELDARRCISYLTIEHHGAIPEALRPLIGNRIYGCDDCQLACPWNRYAQATTENDFSVVRNGLDSTALTELFGWTAQEFDQRLEGSAIRRIGHERWLRNIAVALGNAPFSTTAIAALEARRDDASPLVREHVRWALVQQASRRR